MCQDPVHLADVRAAMLDAELDDVTNAIDELECDIDDATLELMMRNADRINSHHNRVQTVEDQRTKYQKAGRRHGFRG